MSNKTLRKDYKHIAKLKSGLAGWYCPCCNPFGCHPSKMKPFARRMVRRNAKQELKKILNDEM